MLDSPTFDKPLECFVDGDRVVIVGDETFKVKQTGATHQANWAWVVDAHAAYFVVSEALTNIAKHASATQASVTVTT